MFRGISRELMWDIIVQECALYKFRLEDALITFLRCSREELYEEGFLVEHMGIVSSIKKLR